MFTIARILIEQSYSFFPLEDYDQIHISGELFGKQGEFTKEGEQVSVMFHGEKPISVELPPHVFLKVTSAPPGIKGDTATGATKQVILETGSTVNAPLFINEGDLLRIDSRTGAYIERAKQ